MVLSVATLLTGLSAHAGPITEISFHFDVAYQYVQFGPGWGYAWTDGGFGGDRGEDVTGPNGTFPLIGGFTLTSGPLVDIVPGASESFYVHDGGGSLYMTLDLPWKGGTHTGTFLAPLGALTIRAFNEESNAGDLRASLGAGVFDQRTAKILGIKRKTLPSDILLFADTFFAYPDPFREIAAFGSLDIQAEAKQGRGNSGHRVPEPASLALTAMALCAVGLRMTKRG